MQRAQLSVSFPFIPSWGTIGLTMHNLPCQGYMWNTFKLGFSGLVPMSEYLFIKCAWIPTAIENLALGWSLCDYRNVFQLSLHSGLNAAKWCNRHSLLIRRRSETTGEPRVSLILRFSLLTFWCLVVLCLTTYRAYGTINTSSLLSTEAYSVLMTSLVTQLPILLSCGSLYQNISFIALPLCPFPNSVFLISHFPLSLPSLLSPPNSPRGS